MLARNADLHDLWQDTYWLEMRDKNDRVVIVQAHESDRSFAARRTDLREYRVSDHLGRVHRVVADCERRAGEAVRHHVGTRPVGKVILASEPYVSL
jgi:hypothetical protein